MRISGRILMKLSEDSPTLMIIRPCHRAPAIFTENVSFTDGGRCLEAETEEKKCIAICLKYKYEIIMKE